MNIKADVLLALKPTNFNKSQTVGVTVIRPVGWRMETAAPSAEPRRECTLMRYRVSCSRSVKQ